MELDKSGHVKNTLRNLTLILENDPNLKGVVFNQLLDGMEIKGEVPWNHPSSSGGMPMTPSSSAM